ncbi:squamous cell carcinoma antigen recognized by T-cells 3-like [Uloborus diversus]|uniref:squamous cell carcinoma antigen recognized by T-cells 3-like n=1 Tax=Uloborus diversus TaxID=327109 RepID=UPI002409A60A|nr:squamous cell carcinoma antigen recognized by T-cells 3-like [Uloborus diversus]
MSDSGIADVEDDMDNDQDMDSFSNSPERSSDEEDADEEKVEEIQKQVDASPYTYELHVELISLCRKLGDLAKLRAAREKMSQIFPLSSELWLDWLTDEKNIASTPEQKEDVVKLFERAIKDYASVSVWLEYVQFSIGNIGDTWTQSGIENVRQVFERAITAIGLHVAQGCLIWEAYREFESIYLLSLKNKSYSIDELEEQESKIYNLFKRQLSIPLLDMEKTYKEFKEQFGDMVRDDTASIEASYAKSLKKLSQLNVFEDALYVSDPPHYEDYKAYIEYEKKEGEPVRVQNIYERAILENCLKEELWLDYTKYMDQVLKIEDLSLPVHERAVRNCPWCVQLWTGYLRALERFGKPHEKILEICKVALDIGYTKAEDYKELWFAHIDYLRRRMNKVESNSEEYMKAISTVFGEALEQMKLYFWGSESEYAIMKYWIFFTVKYKKDVDSARKLWKDLIDHGHREKAQVWLEFVNFEKLYGDATNYRKVLFQALACVSDWHETFVDLILTYEREEGTLETFEKALLKCETLMQHLNEKRMKKLEQEANDMKDRHSKDRKVKRHHAQKASRNDSAGKLDSNISVQMDAEGFKIPPLPDKVFHSPESKNETNSSIEVEKRKRVSDEEDEPKSKRKKEEKETSEGHGVSVQHDPSKDNRTVFLSNLSYQIDEEKLRDCFSKVGELEEVRLVKDYKGRSKGFCYVVYKSEEDAKKALTKDREMLDGRPMLVSPCEDKKNRLSSQSKFKFSLGLERNKLFIKNLPFSTTKEDLENMFKEYGSLKEVRIVTYRNGHSKGLAYVEYQDEASASNAVVKMDGTQIMDHIISVAISNPPPRKPKKEFSNFSISDSLGGGSSVKGPRGRGRTQLSLLPRSVMRPSAGNKSSTSNRFQNGRKSETENNSEGNKPLSNSDFAAMLKK